MAGPGPGSADQHRNWMGGWAATTSQANPPGLMLWKKVQHYVVVGGAFVNAAAANSADGGPTENQTAKPPLQQSQFPVQKPN